VLLELPLICPMIRLDVMCPQRGSNSCFGLGSLDGDERAGAMLIKRGVPRASLRTRVSALGPWMGMRGPALC